MSSSNINIRVRTQAKQATTALSGLTDAMRKMSRQGNNVSRSMKAIVGDIGGFKRILSGLGTHKLTGMLASSMKVATDVRESIHMFNVSMGDLAESTGEAVDELSELSGMDRITMLDTVGEYNLLARSMGMASDNAAVLAENTNKLALDLSALTNREYSKVAQDLRSGLIGQARTMYKYGVDVTEATIQQEALNQGLTKSIRHMNQGEKMALRYSVIMKQTGLAHGDFAETAHTAANSTRILQSRILELSRSIGSLFLPLIERILPYANALAIAFNEVAKSIARMLGFTDELEGVSNTTSDFGLEDLAEDADESSKKVQKLRQQLMGFDEINLYREDKGQGPLDEVDDAVGDGDYGLQGYDNNLEEMDQRTQEIADKIISKFNDIRKAAEPTTDALNRLWNEGMKDLSEFSMENLSNFYELFIKPVGEFALGEEGLARLSDVMNDMLKGLDWDGTTDALAGLFEAMVKPAEFVITAFIDRVEHLMVPIWEWRFNEGIPRLANVLKNVFEKVNWGKINEGLRDFWDALAGIRILKREAFMWLIENVLEPFAVWTLDTFSIKALELFTQALDTLQRVLEVLKPTWVWFWEDVVMEMGEKLGVEIIDSMDSLIKSLEKVAVWFEENPDKANDLAEKLVKLSGVLIGLGGGAKIVGRLGSNMHDIWRRVRVFQLLNTDLSELIGTSKTVDNVISSMNDTILGTETPSVSEVIKDISEVDADKDWMMDLLDVDVEEMTKEHFDSFPENVRNAILRGNMVEIELEDFAEIKGITEDILDNTFGEVEKKDIGEFIRYEDNSHLHKPRNLPEILPGMDDGDLTIEHEDIVKPGLFGRVGLMFTNLGAKIKGVFAGVATKVGSLFSGLGSTIAGAFTLPGVAIAGLVALVAGAAVYIYKNWDEVKAYFNGLWTEIKPKLKEFWEVIGPKIQEIWDLIQSLWTDVLQPLWGAMEPMIGELLKLLAVLFEKLIVIIGWVASTLGPVLMDVVILVGNILKPILELLVGIIGNILGYLEGVFKIIRGIFELDPEMTLEGIKLVAKNLLGLFEKVVLELPVLLLEISGMIIGALKDLVVNVVKGWYEFLKSLPDRFRELKDMVIEFVNELWEDIKEWGRNLSWSDVLPDMPEIPSWVPFIGKSESDHKVNYSLGNIPQLADGGIVDAGQMFIANEAGPEMVGKYGSKTGVINNEQIVNAVSEGVYKAVTSASMGSDSGGDNEAVMNIDGRELARVILPHMNRESKRQGYKPILEY